MCFSMRVIGITTREMTMNYGAHPQIFADLALNMQVNPESVTQKQYLDEGGFGSVYLASIKLEVKHNVFTTG